MSNDLVNIDRLYNRLLKRVRSKAVKRLIGATAKEQIYNRVKSGYGVNTEGLDPRITSKDKLAALSETYIKFRQGKIAFYKSKVHGKVYATANKKYIRKPKLGKFGSPRRSNLTLSGRMLEAMRYRVNASGIVLDIKNTSRSGEPITNKQLGELVAEKRPFFSLTRTEFKVLRSQIDRIITKEIRNIFK